MKIRKKIATILLIVGLLTIFNACEKDGLIDDNNQIGFFLKLSEYAIYKGEMRNLDPTSEYHLYELGSTLFTDHAEKQRLIKLPTGTKMKVVDDDLPEFPDQTIIAKTFYYQHDVRDPSKGKRIIETRLLIKEKGQWNVANYLWNETQTDAQLIESGYNTVVNFMNKDGLPEVIAYHVPNKRECASCHSSEGNLIPIGPKIRNLNIDRIEISGSINQLLYFQNLNLLGNFDPTQIHSTPNYHDTNTALATRARAYLDINCGHCHNDKGLAADKGLFLLYEVDLDASNIPTKKSDILKNLKDGTMPYIGTSILDKKGVELIEQYINSL